MCIYHPIVRKVGLVLSRTSCFNVSLEAATNGPAVNSPDDERLNIQQWRNGVGSGKPKNSEKNLPSDTSLTENPT
jgi:hypothetical protein